MMDYPLVIFALSLPVQWLAAQTGSHLGRRRPALADAEHQDLEVILAASLTLLGLIIGFTFSMAVTRYDLRKSREADEANAIGTEYVRLGLLPAPDAAKLRGLLTNYLNQRVSFYLARDPRRLEQIDSLTAKLQRDLWSAMQAPATAQPTPIVALAVSGLNDVLNSQGYTQAAWWNRIPPEAWALMGMIAIFCNVLFGFTVQSTVARNTGLFLILPVIVATAFFLIADLDSPRTGVIRVSPQNLINLCGLMRTP
jgi:hypothetical protein